MDIFDSRLVKPMLISQLVKPFNSPDYIFEMKLDGIRCIAYINNFETDIRNKRGKLMIPQVPELSDIHLQVKEKCILDGELIIIKNGLPDFYEIQRRALMSDPFKIKLSAAKYPASFVAYDIMYLNGDNIMDLSLMERKAILSDIVVENEKIAVARYIVEKGIELFELIKQQNLEGIVAKRKDSTYIMDKRTKNWLKCKVLSTDDCIICGYILNPNNMCSLILGQYNGDELVYKGHVTLGASLRILKQHNFKTINYSPFGYIPKGNNDAVWMEPELVCIVEYMPNDKDSYRQPVFKGIRDDKSSTECQVNE